MRNPISPFHPRQPAPPIHNTPPSETQEGPAGGGPVKLPALPKKTRQRAPVARQSVLDSLILANVRCTLCGAGYGECDCWQRCEVCGTSYERGTTCRFCSRDPPLPKKRRATR